MGKMIFCADLHIHDYKNDSEFIDGISLKLKELFDCFQQMCTYAVENNITDIIIGGDVVHHKNLIHTKPFAMFREILEKNNSVTFHIFEGNHGRVDKENKYIALDLLSGISNVRIIKDVTRMDNITFIPDSNELYENIKKTKSNDILCSHFPLSGGKADNGFDLTTKFETSMLNKYKLVLLGDLHSFQKHKLKNGFLYYPGSLIPTNKSETDDKGFIVFDTSDFKVEFIKTSGYRKYIEIILDEESNINDIKQQIVQAKNDNNFITVRSKLKDAPKDILKEASDNASMNIIDIYEEDFNTRGLQSNMTDIDIFIKYLNFSNIKESDIPEYIKLIEDLQ